MVVWKVMLQAAVTGAIFGPLAGAAFGPVELKRPPDPPWRHLLKPEIAASAYDFGIAPPQDLGPPDWSDVPGRDSRIAWQVAYDPLAGAESHTADAYAEPIAGPEPGPEPAADDADPPAARIENGVIVHRAASDAAQAASDVRNAELAAPSADPLPETMAAHFPS